jgi:hypothetical protein
MIAIYREIKNMNNFKLKINRWHFKRIIMLFSSLFLLSVIFTLISWGIPDISSCSIADVPARHHHTHRVEIRNDGTTLVDSKPFFPFGFYHVSWASTSDDRIKHLREIAAGGFNTIHASFKRFERFEDYGNFLNEAERLGMYVLTEFQLTPTVDPIKVVETFKNKPAILGWSIADDVDSYKDGFTPNQIVELHCKFKQEDPDHITYISGSKDNRITKFINTAEVMGVQAYPVGEKRPISWVQYIISLVRKSAPPNRLIIGNVQAFRWDIEGAIIPTFAEVRNMTYQTLLAGAKGIIYYTYFDDSWRLWEHPDLWNNLKDLVPEINAISPILLDGHLREIELGENVSAGIWVSKNQGLAVIVNTSYDKTAKVKIPLPHGFTKAQQLFSTPRASAIVKSGKLSDSVKPLEVQLYSLKA